MFDYECLTMFDSLNVAQQFSSPKTKNGIDNEKSSMSAHFGDDGMLSNGSSESQIFGNGWDNSPSPLSNNGVEGDAETEENSIVHSLSELLRRRSSPMCTNTGKCCFDREHRMSADEVGSGCIGAAQYLQRHRSATVSSTDQVYGGTLAPPNRNAAHQQERRNMDFGGYGMDRFAAMNRRLSDDSALVGGGGCCLASSEMLFDCGASSGYGSPGRTPLASPSAATKGTNSHAVQYIANQLQKLFIDRACFCECPAHTGNGAIYTHRQTCPEQRKQQIYLNGAGGNCGSNGKSFGGVQAVAFSPTATPVLLKATTTTTGTNKNSNKRKLSSVCGGSGGSTSPGPENIVASEDGFDQVEIAEFTQLLSSPKRMPPPRYICHICYQPGHYIGDCPQRFNSPYEELTPYQGRKKCYGEFQCEQCKRKWTSQNSIANEAQSCIKCHIPVFPHKQLPVDKAIALGLVKIQRLPVTNVLATPPTPSAASTPLPSNHGVLTAVL